MKYEIDMKIFIELEKGTYGDANAFAYNIAKSLQMHNEVFATKTTVSELNSAQEVELDAYLKTRNPRSF